MQFFRSRNILWITLIGFLTACKHHPETTDLPPTDDIGNNPIDNATNPCDQDTVYFANTVLPILLSHCSMPGCHNTATEDNDGIVLTSYSQIMNYVEPGDLSSSDLWDNAIAETDPDKIMPPQGSEPLTNEQITAIQTWIEQGALNNSCSACDTTFTFAADILPIIQQNCMGCHNANNPEGSLSLTNHAEIQATALLGGLMNRLNGIGGIMPPNSNGISTCDKNRIQQWIDAGAPNN